MTLKFYTMVALMLISLFNITLFITSCNLDPFKAIVVISLSVLDHSMILKPDFHFHAFVFLYSLG